MIGPEGTARRMVAVRSVAVLHKARNPIAADTAQPLRRACVPRWQHLGLLVTVALVTSACAEDLSGPRETSVRIDGLAPAGQYVAGDTVRVRAEITGAAPAVNSAVQWFQDAVAVGSDPELTLLVQDTGRFVLTAELRLPDDRRVSDRVLIAVRANTAPSLGEVRILGGPTLYDIEPITLMARASDMELPDSIPVPVEWRRSDGAVLALGDSVELEPGSLAVGSHALRVTAADPQGLVANDSLVFEVITSPDRLRWARAFDVSGVDRTHLALAESGMIVFMTWDGAIATDSTGSPLWIRNILSDVDTHSGSLMLDPAGNVYLYGYQGVGWSFTPTGDRRWRRQILGFDPHSRFALSPDGVLYVAGQHRESYSIANQGGSVLARLQPETGEILWEIRRPERFAYAGALVGPSGLVVAGIGRRLVWATLDGSVVTESDSMIRATFGRASADRDGVVYLPSSTSYAYEPNGQLRWSQAAAPSVYDLLVDAEGRAFASAYGQVTAVSTADGAVLWQRTLPGGGIGQAALTADGGMVVAFGTHVSALDRATGTIRWELDLAVGIETSLAVAPDGTIFAADRSGRLLALRGDAPLDTTAPWPTDRADNRRTASVRP